MPHIYGAGYLEESSILPGQHQFYMSTFQGAASYFERCPGSGNLKSFRGERTGSRIITGTAAGDIVVAALFQLHAVRIKGIRIKRHGFCRKGIAGRVPILQAGPFKSKIQSASVFRSEAHTTEIQSLI